jgi:hypothetical protein
MTAAALQPVAVNLLGYAEHPESGDSPFRISADGRPYVPAGDGGIVLAVVTVGVVQSLTVAELQLK